MSEIHLRAATAADLPAIQAVYIDAVQTLGPDAYTAAAVAAWQRWPTDDPEEFAARVLAGHAWVAEVDGTVAAFAEFTPPDHLDFLYTRGQFARMGLASRLHAQLESIARSEKENAPILRTEASWLSRPVFAKLGYEVFADEVVERYGQSFRRFRMRKFLRAAPPATSTPAACRADYPAAFANPPRVSIDTVVQFEHHDTRHPGWFKGRTADGTEGFFPARWFEINASRREATARRDYDARELTVRAGDEVGVIEIEGGWARVMTTDGEIGWLPATVAPAAQG